MKARKISVAVLLGLLMLVLVSIYATQEYDQDAMEIQDVIQRQLRAVEHDDAEAAFSFASASSQDSLGGPDNFLQLIRHEFPVIYKYRKVVFDEYDISADHATQVVQFIDDKDSVWVAIYQMIREKDGKWKVAGCRLVETASISI